jgi:hypothetical protein
MAGTDMWLMEEDFALVMPGRCLPLFQFTLRLRLFKAALTAPSGRP